MIYNRPEINNSKQVCSIESFAMIQRSIQAPLEGRAGVLNRANTSPVEWRACWMEQTRLRDTPVALEPSPCWKARPVHDTKPCGMARLYMLNGNF